jgi:uncharacterized Zn-binding protein involved in type VI secretion
VKVNGVANSLVHKGSNGISVATLPDVCKTPSPGGPVPLPYPNVSQSATLKKGTTTVKVDGGNMIAVKGSEFAVSNGDNPGTLGGVKSSTFMKESTWILYSFDVKMQGRNVCRLSDKKFQNHENTVDLGGEFQSFLAPGAPRPDDQPEICPKGGDHAWKEISSKTVEEGKNDNNRLATVLKDKGSARGYAFENSAIDANMEIMEIQKVGAMFVCSKCGQDQEVDIVGKGQIGEAKSRKFGKVRKRGAQARRLRDIQQKLFNRNKNPRAKLDGSFDDVNLSVEKYQERGFDSEIVGGA